MRYWWKPKIEMAKDLIISLLDAEKHDRKAFDCGESALDDYLKRTACQHLNKGIANTYVLTRRTEPRRVLCFFTLSFVEVDMSEMPVEHRKGLPKSHLPAARLARLAIDSRFQGNSYGRILLVDAMRRCDEAGGGGRGVVRGCQEFESGRILPEIRLYAAS